MSTFESSGVTLTVPEDLEVAEPPSTGLDDWRMGGLAPADAFAAALEDTGADLLPLALVRDPSGGTAGEPLVVHIEDDVPVAVLEDRDGVLGWRVDPDNARIELQRGFRRWRGWAVRLQSRPDTGSLSRLIRGLEPKPALRQVLRPGLLDRPDLAHAWPVLPSANHIVGLPVDRRPRVLVWVHGTFRDTIGTYGDLPRTQAGRRVVQGMIDRYDAVIAYDHPTISVTPGDNARQLLKLLRDRPWPKGLQLDLMSTSRGSLVVRSLVERVVTEQDDLDLSFGKVVMVSPAAGGTLLASPQDWDRWLDHTTNLVRAAADAGQHRFRAATGAFTITTQRLRGLLRLLQALAWGASRPGHLPGLTALSPRSDFIQWLNTSPLPEPLPEVEGYWWVRSNFESEERSLAPPEAVSVLLRVLDAFIDKRFGDRANDLIVDHPNSLRGHPHLASRWRAAHDYAANSDVHHLNLWTFPQTRSAVVKVLGLTDQPVEDPISALSHLGEAPDGHLFSDPTWSALLHHEAHTLVDPQGAGALWRNELLRSFLTEGLGLGLLGGRSALPALDDPYAAGVRVGGVPYDALLEGDPDVLFGADVTDGVRRDRAVEAFYGKGALDWMVRLGAPVQPSPAQPTIVFVPGLPGTHLATTKHGHRVWLSLAQFVRGNLAETARLAPDGLSPGPKGRQLVADGLLKMSYGKAIHAWRSRGHTVVPLPFDWRKPLGLAADELGEKLRQLANQGHPRVVLVCHSTGGVVASLWASRHPSELHRVKRAIFAGVPLAGTFQALALLTGASPLLGLISAASARDPHAQIAQMAASWHGPVDLLPDPAVFAGPSCLSLASWTQRPRPTADALTHGRAVLDDIADSPLLSRTHALVGTNRDTVVQALADPLRPGTARHHFGPGDNAIPLDSALHPDLASVHVANSSGHASLFNDPEVIIAASQLATHGTSMRLPAMDPHKVRELASTEARRPRPTHDLEALAQKLLLGAASAEDILEVL